MTRITIIKDLLNFEHGKHGVAVNYHSSVLKKHAAVTREGEFSGRGTATRQTGRDESIALPALELNARPCHITTLLV